MARLAEKERLVLEECSIDKSKCENIPLFSAVSSLK
jgi:hypothetical protein